MNPIRRFFELIAPLFSGPSLEDALAQLPEIAPVPSGGFVRVGGTSLGLALASQPETHPAQCQDCWYYRLWVNPRCARAPSWHVFCAVHPEGPGDRDCPDRRLLPTSDESG